MTLSFYISFNKKVKKFSSAVALDEYVKKYSLPSNASITMKDEEGNVIGTMLVKTYLKKENENN
jgi:hypothetical protein